MRIPINACVIGFDKRPQGYVTDDVLMMMMKSYQDIQKYIKSLPKYQEVNKDLTDKYLRKFHDALRQSVKGYNAKYVNMIHSYSTMFTYLSGKSSEEDVYLMIFREYEKIKDYSMSSAVRESVLNYTVDYMRRQGFTYKGKQTAVYPSYCFQKDETYIYLPVHELAYLYRKGLHKIQLEGVTKEQIENLYDDGYDVIKVQGGLNKFVSICKEYVEKKKNNTWR